MVSSLVVFGPSADFVGSRRVAPVGLVGAAVAFFPAHGVAWLFVDVVLQGVAVGAVSGALIAVLVGHQPGCDRRREAMMASLGLCSGAGVGLVATSSTSSSSGWLSSWISALVSAIAALFLTLVPSCLAGLLHAAKMVIASGGAGLLLFTAGGAQALSGAWPTWRSETVGLSLLWLAASSCSPTAGRRAPSWCSGHVDRRMWPRSGLSRPAQPFHP